MRCLKSILGIRGGGTRSLMSKLYRAADIDTAEHMLLQRQLHWIGHVIRMQFQLFFPDAYSMGNYSMGSGCRVAQNYATRTTKRRILSKSNIPV